MFVGRERVGGHVRRSSKLARRPFGSLSSWQDQPSHTFVQVTLFRLDTSVAFGFLHAKGSPAAFAFNLFGRNERVLKCS